MSIKIENSATLKLPRRTMENISSILALIPREHLRGIDKLRIVDAIRDPRVSTQQQERLPGLYHPRQGTQPAWFEIAMSTLLPPALPLHKRLLPRLSFKSNLAALIFSLAGQHYYLTLKHSIRKKQLEPAIKAYTEKNLRLWSEQQQNFRRRLFKPFQPTLEHWARALQRKAIENHKRDPIA